MLLLAPRIARPRRPSMLVMLALAGACTRQPSAPPSASPSTPTESPAPGDDAVPPSQTDVPPAKPGPCAEDGRLWDGKPGDCSYEHGGCCYGSPASACAAAGCAEAECQVLESYPAQIRCVTPPGPCEIRHEGQCYSTKESACEAAGCPLERCHLQKSSPMQLLCVER